MRYSGQAGGACAIRGAERCGRGDADMVCGHAASLGATELGEDGANAYIVYLCGIEVWELLDRGFEDLDES